MAEAERAEAEALHEAGRLEEAEAAYRLLLEADPEDARTLHRLAILMWQQDEEQQAFSLLSRALAAQPDDAGLRCTLGDLHQSAGNLNEALRAYRQALALDPSLAAAHGHLGLALQARGDLDEAVAAFRQALALEPESGEHWYHLGCGLQAAGQPDDAAAAYQVALGLLPGDPDALNNLGNLRLEAGDPERAVALFRQALAENDALPQLHYNLGIALKQLGQRADAIAAFRAAVARAPGSEEAWIHLGIALGESGSVEEAAEAFSAALDINPRNLMAWLHLGHTYEAGGRETAAMIAYQSATRHVPDSAEGYLNLGIAQHNRGHISEAAAAYREALRLDPTDGAARHLLDALAGNRVAAAPASYVTELFNDYAARYDEHLQVRLEYRSPQAMREALAQALGPRRFSRGLDLGCGTGLSGAAFADVVARLEGVDLSPQMLERAAERGIYAALHRAELVEFLSREEGSYDLFLAADVLVYLGDLDPLFLGLRSRAAPGALLLFSTERADGEDYVLRETGRFAHPRPYVEALADRCGFAVRYCEEVPLRRERLRWIQGDLYILEAVG